MSKSDPKHADKRHSRIRRVKRVLRYMPRRATIHKYPFLKFFAESARKRPYLWSFRTPEVLPALYAGFILTFLPLQGIQIPVAFCLALIFRSNLMILVALQLISNPFTLVPIYALDYQIGNYILKFVRGYDSQSAIADSFAVETGFTLGRQALVAVRYFISMMLGGMVLGLTSGFVASFFYKVAAKRYERNHPKKPSKRDPELAH